jgi:hypothetical protein
VDEILVSTISNAVDDSPLDTIMKAGRKVTS